MEMSPVKLSHNRPFVGIMRAQMPMWKIIKNGSNLEQMQNSLNKAREIYFEYFPSERMARTKATVRRKAMMGVLLAHSVVHTKHSEKTGKGKPPRVSVK